MNVVDSSGWLEFCADGPNADFFPPTIENIPALIVPSSRKLSETERRMGCFLRTWQVHSAVERHGRPPCDGQASGLLELPLTPICDQRGRL